MGCSNPGGLISQPEKCFLFSLQFIVPTLELIISSSMFSFFLLLSTSHIIVLSSLITPHFLSKCLSLSNPLHAEHGTWTLFYSQTQTLRICEHSDKVLYWNKCYARYFSRNLWEIFKASLRGQIFCFTSHSKKENSSKLKELSDNIAQLDAQYAAAPTPELYEKRIRLQTEFDQASTAKAEHMLLRARLIPKHIQDRVWVLGQSEQTFGSPATAVIRVGQITLIRTTSGSMITDHKQIYGTFAEYFSKLYTSECSTSPGEADSFYQELNLPERYLEVYSR